MVPKQVTGAQVQCWNICLHHLNYCENEGYDFFRRIIIVEKTWIHYHNPEIKHQSMEWKHPQLPIKRKFKCNQQEATYAFFSSLLNSQGPIAEHNQDRSTTVNNSCYCEMCERMRLAVRGRCRGLLSNVILA